LYYGMLRVKGGDECVGKSLVLRLVFGANEAITTVELNEEWQRVYVGVQLTSAADSGTLEIYTPTDQGSFVFYIDGIGIYVSSISGGVSEGGVLPATFCRGAGIGQPENGSEGRGSDRLEYLVPNGNWFNEYTLLANVEKLGQNSEEQNMRGLVYQFVRGYRNMQGNIVYQTNYSEKLIAFPSNTQGYIFSEGQYRTYRDSRELEVERKYLLGIINNYGFIKGVINRDVRSLVVGGVGDGVMRNMPVKVNRVTANQSSFEERHWEGFTFGNMLPNLSGTYSVEGSYSLRLEAIGSGNYARVQTESRPNMFIEGETYEGSVYVRADAAMSVELSLHDAGGVMASQSFSLAAGVWTRLEISGLLERPTDWLALQLGDFSSAGVYVYTDLWAIWTGLKERIVGGECVRGVDCLPEAVDVQYSVGVGVVDVGVDEVLPKECNMWHRLIRIEPGFGYMKNLVIYTRALSDNEVISIDMEKDMIEHMRHLIGKTFEGYFEGSVSGSKVFQWWDSGERVSLKFIEC